MTDARRRVEATAPAARKPRRAAPTTAAAAASGAAADAAALRARALAAHRAGRLDEASETWRALIRLAPDDGGAWTNLGALLRRRGARRLAVSCQRRAAALRPDDAAVLNNLGNALHDADLCEEALAARRRVLALRPEAADSHAMLAVSLRALNRLEEAAAAADAGLARHPGHAELTLQKAMALLAMGDHAAGFALFAARWEVGEIERPPCREPEWNGEDLAGRAILAIPEQGFGDTILMARFLPGLKARGARVLLACKPPLTRLFRGIAGADAILEIGARKPPVDFFVPLMELPRLLGIRDGAPPPAPRLHVPPEALARGARIVAPHAGALRVGVAWAGSPAYKADFKRSFDFRLLAPLWDIPGVRLFSLAKGPAEAGLRAAPESVMIAPACGDDRDFADAAGVVRALDLVICVDTAIAHLAASLGRPTWTLLAFSPYWLWGPAGERTPWHPTMRLFRQRRPGDWEGVIADVAAALAPLAARAREGRA